MMQGNAGLYGPNVIERTAPANQPVDINIKMVTKDVLGQVATHHTSDARYQYSHN
jgi:hypothetical protein